MNGRYKPDYLSFAPTYECNLHCVHCYILTDKLERLSINAGKQVVMESGKCGIQEIIFTGGEPFLYFEFIIEKLTKRQS